MRYAYMIAAPSYVPPGRHLYRNHDTAAQAARREDGCGLRCGMRPVRVRVTAAEFAAAA